MSLQTARTALRDGDPGLGRGSELEALLRRMVELVARPGLADQARLLKLTPELQGELVCELELGGSRYLLLQVQPQLAEQISLSPRELAIARLIAKGLPNKTIGTILEISPWTVATHLRRIFGKLEVTTRAAMIAKLGDRNLI